MEENIIMGTIMIVITDPKTFCFSFDYPKDVDENLKREIEFIIKSNTNLAEKKIKNETEQLLLKYKQGNNIHEHGNSETSQPHKFILSLSQRLDLRKSDKYVALQNLPIYYTWKNIRQQYKNNKPKIIGPTWNDEFELPDGSYSISDIQDYIKNMKH